MTFFLLNSALLDVQADVGDGGLHLRVPGERGVIHRNRKLVFRSLKPKLQPLQA